MSGAVVLVLGLGIILAGAELFVNGVEWLGHKLNLSEGAVGSVLAAVGTALPETMIPIIAILFGHGQSGHAIGIGAILGAPLMLATLAMFVTGLAVLGFRGRRLHGSRVRVDFSSMSRDLGFFLVVYTAALLCGLIPPQLRQAQVILALLMIAAYFWYVVVMIKEERDIESDDELPSCYFTRGNQAPSLFTNIVQVIIALVFIVAGANLFVKSISQLATLYGLPAFVLSLIIAPIATELPEKFNSVIWVSRDKDTLAVGNITGAMVFQSSIIPALGILLTSWQLTTGALLSGMLALMAAALYYWRLRTSETITGPFLLLGGGLYAIFILLVVKGFIA